MKNYKLVSFWSEPNSSSTFYQNSAKNLIEDCKKYDLDYHIEHIDNQGGYWANARHKAYFIKDCMDKFPDQHILWIDADTRILKNPIDYIPKQDFDFGAVMKGSNYPDGQHPFFGHCLLFNHTEKSKELIEEYCDYEGGADHALLSNSIRKIIGVENVFKIDPSFLKIGSAPKNIVLKK